jgi:hypothetical protein
MIVIRIILICGVLLFSGGCFLGKKPAVVVPVSSPTASAPAASVPAKPAATQPTPAPTTPVQATPSPTPAAPPADAAKPSPFGGAGNTTPAPKPITPAPVKTVPAPALGAILTADKRKELDAAYQSDLKQANLVLSKLSGRTLTTEQTDYVSRARAWIRQAAQYHDRDLATAAELARRARVLTQDLAGALK